MPSEAGVWIWEGVGFGPNRQAPGFCRSRLWSQFICQICYKMYIVHWTKIRWKAGYQTWLWCPCLLPCKTPLRYQHVSFGGIGGISMTLIFIQFETAGQGKPSIKQAWKSEHRCVRKVLNNSRLLILRPQMGFHIWSRIRNRSWCWIGSKIGSDLPKMEYRTMSNTQFRREVTITVEDPLLGYTKEFHCPQVKSLSWEPTFLDTHMHPLSNV